MVNTEVTCTHKAVATGALSHIGGKVGSNLWHLSFDDAVSAIRSGRSYFVTARGTAYALFIKEDETGIYLDTMYMPLSWIRFPNGCQARL
jgi:hypothetical protein